MCDLIKAKSNEKHFASFHLIDTIIFANIFN